MQGALVHPVEAGFVTVHQGRCRVLRKSLPGLAWRIVVAVTPMFAQAASEAASAGGKPPQIRTSGHKSAPVGQTSVPPASP